MFVENVVDGGKGREREGAGRVEEKVSSLYNAKGRAFAKLQDGIECHRKGLGGGAISRRRLGSIW